MSVVTSVVTSCVSACAISVLGGGAYVDVEDGYTADKAGKGVALGWYKLVGTNTPSAAVSMVVR